MQRLLLALSLTLRLTSVLSSEITLFTGVAPQVQAPQCGGADYKWTDNPNRRYYSGERVEYNGKIYTPCSSQAEAPLSDAWNRDEGGCQYRDWGFVGNCQADTPGTLGTGDTDTVDITSADENIIPTLVGAGTTLVAGPDAATGSAVSTGCMVFASCNYNAEATLDNGSCTYVKDGECDCDGNTLDDCDVCGGDGLSCVDSDSGPPEPQELLSAADSDLDGFLSWEELKAYLLLNHEGEGEPELELFQIQQNFLQHDKDHNNGLNSNELSAFISAEIESQDPTAPTDAGCYIDSTTPVGTACTCHLSCYNCGYYNMPIAADDCITCADSNVQVKAEHSDGTGYCSTSSQDLSSSDDSDPCANLDPAGGCDTNCQDATAWINAGCCAC